MALGSESRMMITEDHGLTAASTAMKLTIEMMLLTRLNEDFRI